MAKKKDKLTDQLRSVNPASPQGLAFIAKLLAEKNLGGKLPPGLGRLVQGLSGVGGDQRQQAQSAAEAPAAPSRTITPNESLIGQIDYQQGGGQERDLMNRQAQAEAELRGQRRSKMKFREKAMDAMKKRRSKSRLPQLPPHVAEATARAKARRQAKPEDLAAELFTTDLITGSGEAAGPGIIPFASMPEEIRRQMPIDAPPIGWDIAKLPPEKQLLLRRLMAIGSQGGNNVAFTQ